MSFIRMLSLALVALLCLPAVAGEAEALDVTRATLRLRRASNQRPDSNLFDVRANLPPSAELAALDVPASEVEVRIGDQTAFFVAKNSYGKLFKERGRGIYRAKFRRFLIRVDTQTGAVRVRSPRTDLAHLSGLGSDPVAVSIRFDDIECATSLDFDVRGTTWRYRSPRD